MPIKEEEKFKKEQEEIDFADQNMLINHRHVLEMILPLSGNWEVKLNH
jgi:hypothetical protein